MSTPAENLPATPIKPGLYPDISNEQYHEGEGISSSGVKLIADKTALHFWEERINPDREKKPPTQAMKFGTAVHTLVFEPEKFELEIAVEPEVNKRTKAGQFEIASFLEANKGKTIITPSEKGLAYRIASAVRRHPTCEKILQEGKAEQSLYWNDPETGVLCKIRPDWQNPILMADLKTTVDAGPDDFERAIYNYGYHISAAMYLEGWRVAFGEDLPFVFTAAEKEPPFAVANYRIHDEALALGRKIYRQALQTYARCLEKGTERKHWHGYPLDIQTINVPAWAYRKTTP